MFVIVNIFLYAFAGGLIPSMIWLWFWLHEDSLHPEPKRMILRSFVFGMVAVLLVLPFERVVSVNLPEAGLISFILFALIEELFKYGSGYVSALRTKDCDEPIDVVIYLISAALGFAALENAFFILQPLLAHDTVRSVITNNLRFMGANLLHVISSATIGIFIAFAFYKKKWKKRLFLLIGIIMAIVLHALFNFSIIGGKGENILFVFGFVWIGIICLILAFEKIKNIENIENII